MAGERLELPEALRRAVAADLRPVRPLAPPPLRALAVAAWVPLGVVLVLALLGLRPDAAALGWPAACGALLLEVAAGLVLVVLALDEAIPARGAGTGRATAAIALAFAALALQAWFTRSLGAGTVVADPLVQLGPTCLALQAAVGLPALAIVAALVVRARPLRAVRAGALAGTGAGLMAEGIYHLHCSIADLRHVLVWHAGAVVALMLVGIAGGLAWERLQRDRLVRRGAAAPPAPRNEDGRTA